MFIIEIPNIVKKIANVLKRNGNDAFVVGGFVRDSIIGKESKDIDIATDLQIDEIIVLFKTVDFVEDIKRTGDKFPVARIFTTCGSDFEIATFREEMGNGKETTFKTVTDIKADISRRDFTFNALYADAITGFVHDEYNGIKDLHNGVIKFVGDPISRINEDRTRLMRLVRFASSFNLDIDDLDAIRSNNVLRKDLKESEKVKLEMIVTEFEKGFKRCVNQDLFIANLLDIDILEEIFDGLDISGVEMIPEFELPFELFLFTILINNKSEDIKKGLHRLKWSSFVSDRVSFILDIASGLNDINNIDIRRFVKRFNDLKINDIFKGDQTLIKFVFGDGHSKFKVLSEFMLTVGQKDFPNLSGKDLGDAIKEKEMQLFLNKL